jgi:cytochrome c
MRNTLLAAALVALAACATPADTSADASLTRGAALAQSQCGACHAVAARGDSPAPEAPPFRRLSQHYPVADLEEALAEGISVGHPAMPAFALAPEDAEALVRYLESIQDANAPA